MNRERKMGNRLSDYINKAKDLFGDKSAIEQKLSEAWEKAKGLDPTLKELMENVELFIEVVRAYIRGEYRLVETKSIVVMIAAILYFINPFDVIPDFLPLIGFTDDAAVLLFVLGKVKYEIDNYRIWKENQQSVNYES
jgi:uncharacterized membrane protein YkvA (DUF1232 family)